MVKDVSEASTDQLAELLRRRVLRPGRVMEYLDISEPTFYEYVRRGILPAVRLHRAGQLRIPAAAVFKLLEQRVEVKGS